MKKLIEHNVIRNTSSGYIDKDGYTVGYYRTRNRRYIEDKFADMAKEMT